MARQFIKTTLPAFAVGAGQIAVQSFEISFLTRLLITTVVAVILAMAGEYLLPTKVATETFPTGFPRLLATAFAVSIGIIASVEGAPWWLVVLIVVSVATVTACIVDRHMDPVDGRS